LLQQARNDNNKTVTPGITIQNTAVSKNNFILSSLPTTQSFADGDYLVISVLANHPSFGKIRSKELLIGKVIIIVGDVTTVMNAEDVEELITNSNLDDAVGVDEDGNSLTGDQLKDILEKIKNGDVQGRVTIIQ
jgi:hypothetical protein